MGHVIETPRYHVVRWGPRRYVVIDALARAWGSKPTDYVVAECGSAKEARFVADRSDDSRFNGRHPVIKSAAQDWATE